jgi:predicted N-acetyltransferase YhbS
MEIELRTIMRDDYEKTYAFQCEYLDVEHFPDFVRRVENNPDLYFVAMDGNEIIGVCYGSPSKKDESVVHLQGIAVNLDRAKGYARVGIGSTMVHAFESGVKKRGYKVISLGSADDPKAEAFYLKNGFKPIELVAKNLHSEELDRVPVDDYESGNARREDLRRKHNPREVIFIFEKYVK